MRPNIGEQVDQTMLLLIGVCFAFLAIIAIAMFVFLYKYNAKRSKKTEDIHGNTPLEIIWTVVPTIIVLVLFFYGWKGFENMRDIPEDSMPISVTAQMWKWNFEYENGKKSDTLYVPANKDIRMNIFSIDVNHSFYIPAYRVKEDAVPGRENRLWFQSLGPDTLVITCAEYCGLDHSIMLTDLIILPEDEFLKWYNTPDVETTTTSDTTSTGTDTTKVPAGNDTTSGQTGQDTNTNSDTTR
jgi:cytochrome c oxidase subunit II